MIRKQFLYLVLIIILIQSILWTQNEENFIFYSGLFASSSSLFFVASPLGMYLSSMTESLPHHDSFTVSIKEVVRTKSTECLPFPFIFCSFIVGSLWFTYGFLVHDYFIMTPNLIGSSVSFLQLLLFLIFPTKSITVKVSVN